MELRKKHTKNVDQKALKSGLFGIIGKSESLNIMIDGISELSNIEVFKGRREIQNAMLEAEYRRAQINELVHQMKCV